MKKLRPFKDLGKTSIGWLESWHSFSFGNYQDRGWMSFGHLRVINNDIVAGGAGFSPHPHENMEIMTYVMRGRLAHRDSLGSVSVIEPGNIQLMSAGSGITHSEYNAEKDQDVHLYQVWLRPNIRNTAPGYTERALKDVDTHNKLAPIVTRDGRDDTLLIKQNATISLGRFEAGQTLTLPKSDDQDIWLQVTDGACTIDDATLETGDGIGITGEDAIIVKFANPTELLVFFMDHAA